MRLDRGLDAVAVSIGASVGESLAQVLGDSSAAPQFAVACPVPGLIQSAGNLTRSGVGVPDADEQEDTRHRTFNFASSTGMPSSG